MSDAESEKYHCAACRDGPWESENNRDKHHYRVHGISAVCNYCGEDFVDAEDRNEHIHEEHMDGSQASESS